MTDLKETARNRLDAVRDHLVKLSHRIHENPEIRYEEQQASAWLAELLAAEGMTVDKPYCDLPTAFRATAGSGPLHIAVCSEYDALPEIGHGCGHNIIATAGAGAGIAAAAVADAIGATVSVIGTPAEEGGGGKIVLLDRGGFGGVHAAMMVHPAPIDVLEGVVLAAQRVEVHYHGKEAHASASPWRGINAADAITVAQTAIGLLRQYMRPTDRVHGIVIKGGDAPNVIPAHTIARYSIRARSLAHLETIRDKVYRCFEAGAVATGCTLEIQDSDPPYAEMHPDPDIVEAYRQNAEALGRRFVEIRNPERYGGSTDMGNVSLAMPAIHPMIGVNAPVPTHTREFAEYAAGPDGDQAVYDGALALAWTIVDIATDEAVRERLLSGNR
jgi:amidohydrolase